MRDEAIFNKSTQNTPEAYKRAIRELTHLYLRLRLLDKAKDEFISIASHELRNPMAIIKGNISMILAGDAGAISPEVKDILTDVIVAVERQIRLVNELLDVSRIEAGIMYFNLKEVNVIQLSQLLANSLKGVVKMKEVTIEVVDPKDPLPAVQADQDKISQVLINLVTNAIKFTNGGSIKISFHKNGGFIVTSVTDTGEGIPAEQKEFLFKKFSKPAASNVGTISSGSGLGLYISKKYIEKLGGDIWLEKSTPKLGSTFCFSLPIAGSAKASEVADDFKSVQSIKNARESLKGGPYG
ncbi:MAG: hypothetical protein A3F35_01500 [Candidatus Woykebacteria bacterium RIFCSPHIGHO2_12_FULL_45_10]|uniref:histidine kinase n=1 Tax=Candidatus Woykebacteria bacterium RIFCSPHIGHO2_12_FULL_45_10 TaxID=1802603 RepID=A0A1G1WQB0_9BACT|nr:MAG: hypothetical protein A3F35_01500 [Candidatus Woykebacteria bacterium RIFCSPHIGHO2_12_FULL_45_10]